MIQRIRDVFRSFPIAPSMETVLEKMRFTPHRALVDERVVFVSLLSMATALLAALCAVFLVHLIGFFTNLAFFHRISMEIVQPSQAPFWGWWVFIVPALGGVVVGLMARYGSPAIRGHGIPEAMEQVLTNESRIPWRLTFLKPISAAIAIGTGGPFGAEGPIIATGGALGSVFGQIFKTTATERKVLLAAGAAAGMTATFGSPIASVLLAMELLLFEFSPRALIPVALASATANAARIFFSGEGPMFQMAPASWGSGLDSIFFIVLGIIIGIAAVIVTKLVYWIEDEFEHLPVHWMWWPAIGGLAVGLVGYFSPKTLGVGYNNIEDILNGAFVPYTLAAFCILKLVSWAVSLGSGTSGGTLAPLFTIGGGLGYLVGLAAQHLVPSISIDPRVAALVGMAAIFAGASRALLASIVFAFEITQQPTGLLPLLFGCTASFLISCYGMRNSIMTEKIARRGVFVPSEFIPNSPPFSPVKAVMRANHEAGRALLEQHKVSVKSEQPLRDAVKIMKRQKLDHIAVVEDSKAVGEVALADILAFYEDGFRSESHDEEAPSEFA